MQSPLSTTILAENSVWSAPISQMAKAICSTAAIQQLFEIVRGHRDLEPTALRMHPSRDQSRGHDLTQRLKNDTDDQCVLAHIGLS